MSGEANRRDQFIDPHDLDGVTLDLPTLRVGRQIVENMKTKSALKVRLGEEEPKSDRERRDNIIKRNERDATLTELLEGFDVVIAHAEAEGEQS